MQNTKKETESQILHLNQHITHLESQNHQLIEENQVLTGRVQTLQREIELNSTQLQKVQNTNQHNQEQTSIASERIANLE